MLRRGLRLLHATEQSLRHTRMGLESKFTPAQSPRHAGPPFFILRHTTVRFQVSH